MLAGGCFWGVQGVFQHVKGVSSAVSGYAGGEASTAQYETVGTGTTGHAESVRITYDPGQVTFGQLLRVFFTVVHDPTELNRQGPDVGEQYRSAIFPQNDVQKNVADAYITQINEAQVFDTPIVTRTDRDSGFFPAEDYHQDYLALHPTVPYITANDMPKLDDLRQTFPELYRDQPVAGARVVQLILCDATEQEGSPRSPQPGCLPFGVEADRFVHRGIAAEGSTDASILRIRLSRSVNTSTANSRRSMNANSTGWPAGPLTSVAPRPR